MSWVTFYVVQANGNTVADGQCNFTCTIANSVITAAQLQYNPSAATPPPSGSTTTIFNLTAVSIALNADGTYHLGGANLSSKFNIPPKGSFSGGNYNTLTSCTYNPTTNEIKGVFQDVGLPANDPDCSWDATASIGDTAKAQKASH